MQFFNFKDYAKSWSTWVLAGVTVPPILDANVQAIADFLPASWKPYSVTALGSIVRAIKQKG